MIMIQGGLVDVASVVPKIVSNSTCEAEYTTAACANSALMFIRKIWNEMTGRDPDAPLTVPFGLDSQSAIDTANSRKETTHTRHMRRRIHFFRESVARSEIFCFHVPGESNWTNSLTKPLPADMLAKETKVYQVEVPP